MMSSKKKPAKAAKNRARDAGEVVALGVEVSHAHREVLDSIAKSEKRTRRTIVERALESEFRTLGIEFPPAPQ